MSTPAQTFMTTPSPTRYRPRHVIGRSGGQYYNPVFVNARVMIAQRLMTEPQPHTHRQTG